MRNRKAQQEKQGIVFKAFSGEGECLVHRDTIMAYLDNLIADEKGWTRFRFTINTDPSARSSHKLTPVPPYKNRETKIAGPTQFKNSA